MPGLVSGIGGYSGAQLRRALTGAARTWDFRFDLLDVTGSVRGTVDVQEGSRTVRFADLADVQRTCEFTLSGSAQVNFSTDRVRPVARLRMPDGGWAEWPLGVFLLSAPKRTRSYRSTPDPRQVTGFDLGLILRDDKTLDRFTLAAGVNYIAAVASILSGVGLPTSGLSADDRVLPAAREWEPGTSKAVIVNALLGAINYRSLYFDGNGVPVGTPYRAPGDAAVLWEYQPGPRSVLLAGAEEELDTTSVPNAWVAVVSEPDTAPLVARYVNSSPNSPTSTVNVGRTIVDYREGEQAADLATLQAKVNRYAQEASQVYARQTFSTALMPFHEAAEVITLDTEEGPQRYRETEWQITLAAGAPMTHTARRVVTV